MRPHEIRRVRHFCDSFRFDARLWREDADVLRAHTRALAEAGLLDGAVRGAVLAALDDIAREVGDGLPSGDHEDVHGWLDAALRERIGAAAAGRLQLARARNDQAATGLRMHVRRRSVDVMHRLAALVRAFATQAAAHVDTVMPGFTHMQKAQPITFGFYCAAFAEMFLRDAKRLQAFGALADECPLGAGALAGTPFAIDRSAIASELGFARPCRNGMDAVASRDFVLDVLYACMSVGVHLSRFAEDVVVWTSQPFDFLHLPDALVTRSSIMPHKRNPDAAQLLRAKAGRLAGNLHAFTIVTKALAPAYAKDLQEDKEPLFDSIDTTLDCLEIARLLVEGMQVQREAMRAQAALGFCTSTDFADLLAKEGGMPFDVANHTVTALVREAQARGCTLGRLPANVVREIAGVEPPANWAALDDPAHSVALKTSVGGVCARSVQLSLTQLGAELLALEATWPPIDHATKE